MSRSLKLTPEEVASLAAFLDGLTKLTDTTGWRAGAYGSVGLVCDGTCGEQIISISGGKNSPYFVDDSNGD